MSYPVLDFHPSAARTASGYATGNASDVARFATCDIAVVVSAVTGTNPTLDITVEQTLDGSNYFVTDTFSQFVGTGSALKQSVRVSGSTMRLHYVIGGTATPTFTFDARASFKK